MAEEQASRAAVITASEGGCAEDCGSRSEAQAAEAESAALKDRTLREIEAAKQQAVTEINNHAAELGTAVARKILQRNVTADDQRAAGG